MDFRLRSSKILMHRAVTPRCSRSEVPVSRDVNFTLVQLRYFAAAAEEESMTGTANRLVVSQSAVSTAVRNLERELGVQLLIRHHARGLSLTPAGERSHRELRDFLSHAEQLAEAAHAFGSSVAGDLSVGCFVT